MNNNDQMFRDNNPRRIAEGHFTAYLGYYPSFGSFVAAYRDAVESLYRRVSEGNDTPDQVAFPLLFLMRHTLELGYKYSLAHLCKLNSTAFDPENKERHSLSKLHMRLRDEYYKAVGDGLIPDRDKESFEEYYALTDASMKRFDSLDPSSTTFRFPKKDEYPAFSNGTRFNLLTLKNEFDAGMILLTVMADVIAQYDDSEYGYQH